MIGKYWTYEKCRDAALLCNTRTEFIKKFYTAYRVSKINNWYGNICINMKFIGNKYKRCIYAYEFSNNHVYVGLTYDIVKRQYYRDLNSGDTVSKYIKLTGLIPIRKQLTEYVSVEEACKLENFYVNKYLNDGWNLLNKKKTGGIGRTTTKWTKSKCIEEALKYRHRKEFQLNSRSAYDSAWKNKWLEDICSHMKKPKRKIIWTFHKCKNEALKYRTKKEFRIKSGNIYSASIKNKWINDISKHMINGRLKENRIL